MRDVQDSLYDEPKKEETELEKLERPVDRDFVSLWGKLGRYLVPTIVVLAALGAYYLFWPVSPIKTYCEEVVVGADATELMAKAEAEGFEVYLDRGCFDVDDPATMNLGKGPMRVSSKCIVYFDSQKKVTSRTYLGN